MLDPDHPPEHFGALLQGELAKENVSSPRGGENNHPEHKVNSHCISKVTITLFAISYNLLKDPKKWRKNDWTDLGNKKLENNGEDAQGEEEKPTEKIPKK